VHATERLNNVRVVVGVLPNDVTHNAGGRIDGVGPVMVYR